MIKMRRERQSRRHAVQLDYQPSGGPDRAARRPSVQQRRLRI